MTSLALQRTHSTVGGVLPVAPDVACLQLSIVNVCFIGAPDAGDRGWVLVDAGLKTSGRRIARAAAERFGEHARPAAIVLTHGHFDHVGSLRSLAERWDALIYAHELELPYLDGRSDYPPPDPSVGGGLMARMAPLFPKHGIDVSDRLRTLPADGRLPALPGWRWVHTPGHTPGHVSLFRQSDRVLIAGDAFVTTRQESLKAVLGREQQVSRPPAYFTIDWEAAGRSVRELAELRPSVAATGHGIPMSGERLRRELQDLADHFEQAMPDRGRYVDQPAIADETGIVAVPPRTASAVPTGVLLGLAFTAGAAIALGRARARRERERFEPRYEPRNDWYRSGPTPTRATLR